MIGAGEILRETRRLLSVDPSVPILAILVLAGLGFLADSGLVTANSFNTLITGATLAFQYAVTRRLLERLGYPMPGKPRGLAFIGLGILAGLGILVGLVLLVVPGIILIVRWSLATPMLLSSEDGVVESMRESWRQTEGHFWTIFVCLLVIYLPGLFIMAAGLALAEAGGMTFAGVMIADLAFNASVVGGWLMVVALFSLLNRTPAVSEVFE